mmetsp:Transcript_101653/g.180535  ORF Transcript_101653/g.180535 Transcript_101653/m.180535 type:complete len:223 (+) Transcript_101653:56-724(+)
MTLFGTAPSAMTMLHCRVNNTFIEFFECEEEQAGGAGSPGTMQRSSSDSSLLSCRSSRSSNSIKYMLWTTRSSDTMKQKTTSEYSTSCSESEAPELPPAQLPEMLPVPPLVQMYHEETGTAIQVLRGLFEQGVLAHIPRNDEGELASLGSQGHVRGTCIPCIFWFRDQCQKGLACTHCHFRHPGQKIKRHKPNKRARELIRKAKESQAENECHAEPLVPGSC